MLILTAEGVDALLVDKGYGYDALTQAPTENALNPSLLHFVLTGFNLCDCD